MGARNSTEEPRNCAGDAETVLFFGITGLLNLKGLQFRYIPGWSEFFCSLISFFIALYTEVFFPRAPAKGSS